MKILFHICFFKISKDKTCGRDFPVGVEGDIKVGLGCIDSDNTLALWDNGWLLGYRGASVSNSNLAVCLELGGGVTSMEGLLTFGIGNSNPSLSLNILDVAGLLVLLSNEDALIAKKENHKK